MATFTIVRRGRRLLVLPAYSLRIQDKTGNINFHGYGYKEAHRLADVLKVVIGDRPIGPLAVALYDVLTARPAKPGEEWVARF